MNIFDVLVIGIALAMDAFALTVANCTAYKDKLNTLKEWAMPTAFGFFQFLMPVIGYFLGSFFSEYVSAFSGFITAGIFFILALKIVIDNVKEAKNPEVIPQKNEFTFYILLLQAVATSIDALVIGMTFAVSLSLNIFVAGIIIGAVTFIIVSFALIVGKTLGELLGKYATWTGAVILIILAVKNLLSALL